jgi:hypothetical protein
MIATQRRSNKDGIKNSSHQTFVSVYLSKLQGKEEATKTTCIKFITSKCCVSLSTVPQKIAGQRVSNKDDLYKIHFYQTYASLCLSEVPQKRCNSEDM